MTLGAKIALIAIAGTGAVGGSVGVSYILSQPSNLREALIKAGHTPLEKNNGDHSETWEKLANKYATEPQQPKLGELTIKITQQKLEDGALEKFKSECENLFTKKPKDNDYSSSLEKAEIWCIKESKKIATEN